MTERVSVLDELLGEELTGYHRENDRTILEFDDGTLISFEGYHSYPNADEELQAIWRKEYDFVRDPRENEDE